MTWARSRILPVVWLTIVWMALWEGFDWATAAAGILIASLLTLAFGRVFPGPRGRFRPVAAARFVLFFTWKLIEASSVVAWEVVTPRNRINQGIVAIPIRGVSDLLTMVVANAITLTPGTVTLEVHREPVVLYVHVLHLRDIEAVRAEVLHLEALAIRAFGSPEAVAMLGDVGKRAGELLSQASDAMQKEEPR